MRTLRGVVSRIVQHEGKTWIWVSMPSSVLYSREKQMREVFAVMAEEGQAVPEVGAPVIVSVAIEIAVPAEASK